MTCELFGPHSDNCLFRFLWSVSVVLNKSAYENAVGKEQQYCRQNFQGSQLQVGLYDYHLL